MAKNNLVKDIDDLKFETDVDSTEMEDLEDISEEELAEIEELVDEKPKKKKKSAKKKPKKRKAKTKKSKKTKNLMLNGSMFYIILGLVIVALVLAIGIPNNWFVSDNTGSGVAAYVNSEPILVNDLNERYEKASSVSLFPITKEEVLNTLIEQKLIEQEASKFDIIVTPEEVEESLNELLAIQGLTKEQIEENLALSGATIDDLLIDLNYYMLLEKLGNETFAKDISVSNDELINYLGERTLVRHILIISEEEDNEIYNTLSALKAELEADDSTFCQYVTEISQDTASIAECGKYFFKEGDMVPEFEEASFSMDINELSIIKTIYGYHLIQRLDFDEETTINAKESIIADKKNIAFGVFLEDVKADADIEILSLENAVEETGEDSPFEIVLDDVILDEAEVVEEETDEVISDIDVIVEEPVLDDIVEEEIVVEEPEVIEIIVDEEVIVEEEPELIMYKPTVKFFYSETDEDKADITQLIRDLELQEVIDVEWRCIRVNLEDKQICIDLYGEYEYEMAMIEAKELGLQYSPTIFIDDIVYVETYNVNSVREAICDIAGC
jgi:foldase protein PrsA